MHMVAMVPSIRYSATGDAKNWGAGPPYINDNAMTRPAMRYEFPCSSITLCLAMRLCSPPSNRALFCASSANTKRKNSLLGPPSSTAASEMNVTRIPPEYTLFLRDNTSFVSLQTCRLLTAIHRDGSSCASISSF